MDVFKQDISAIDMVIVALRKGHFFNIEGDEVLALSSHVQRLVNLKARIQKSLEAQSMSALPTMNASTNMNVSPPRPIAGMEHKALEKDEPEKKAVNE